ncbi:MAG: hypothetical protein ACHBN1_00600 [Heteroscytonema crispum UTEX LB 1556]
MKDSISVVRDRGLRTAPFEVLTKSLRRPKGYTPNTVEEIIIRLAKINYGTMGDFKNLLSIFIRHPN